MSPGELQSIQLEVMKKAVEALSSSAEHRGSTTSGGWAGLEERGEEPVLPLGPLLSLPRSKPESLGAGVWTVSCFPIWLGSHLLARMIPPALHFLAVLYPVHL